jgi:hypothetical protein
MYKIETQEMSPEFLKCWQAAGIHIDNQVQGGMKSWLKATPYPRSNSLYLTGSQVPPAKPGA